ncbi:hypothetical protein KUH03_02945 [Sphingobacterium sp. E70]|uniref:hypothetical protein n=1 Tax=Sphingobacterium sp. E70 TaxID=2853439 RepID=UPI00211BDAA2|nr:hypothetical protein [Sphingobacterium sp. E70]ULT25951.1 hypothetical protein KUH03_02945 [Sphingobacterium sp. E70]
MTGRGIDVIVFHDLHKNPVKSDVLQGGDVYRGTIGIPSSVLEVELHLMLRGQ